MLTLNGESPSSQLVANELAYGTWFGGWWTLTQRGEAEMEGMVQELFSLFSVPRALAATALSRYGQMDLVRTHFLSLPLPPSLL